MTGEPRCALHPELPTDGICARCGHGFCADCLRDWNGRPLCPPCRSGRVRRRLVIAGIVTVMVSAPAAIIAWGFWARMHRPPDRARPAVEVVRPHPRAGGAAPRLRRAEELAKAGRPRRARDILHRLLARDPRHLGALHLLARMARDEGRPAEVLRLTTRLLSYAPASQDARLWQAEAYGRLQMPAKAETTLRKGLRAAPRATRIALALADLLAAQRRDREAVTVLHGVLQRGPDAHHQRLQHRLRQLEARLP